MTLESPMNKELLNYYREKQEQSYAESKFPFYSRILYILWVGFHHRPNILVSYLNANLHDTEASAHLI